MANRIVILNVSQTVAPTPSNLQKTGALISQGATTLGVGSSSFLTQLSDLTPILTGGKAITSALWATGTVTVTTTTPHGFTIADTLTLTISGMTYTGTGVPNGTFTCSVTGASTFTYPLAVTPGTVTTTSAIYTPEDVAELNAMATTFFGQGSATGVYVLELGPGNATDGATALQAWITANPNVFYSYLVPRYWDANSGFVAMLAGYESTTAKTYFFVTTTSATYTSYTALMKNVFTLIEAPGIPTTEFSLAAVFQVTLNYSPSTVNQVTPLAFAYVYGVTPYPTKGNAALLSSFQSAFTNVIGTGAEGGISNTILFWGTTQDGNPFNYWYACDWI